jgi:hypothetical protein
MRIMRAWSMTQEPPSHEGDPVDLAALNELRGVVAAVLHRLGDRDLTALRVDSGLEHAGEAAKSLGMSRAGFHKLRMRARRSLCDCISAQGYDPAELL